SPFTVKADSFKNDRTVELDKLQWKYQAGDNIQWAAADFNDSDWKQISNSEINADPTKALGDWNGRAWFRLRITVDESIVNQPLAFRMWHWGASEIYVDGRLVQSFGVIERESDIEYNPRGVFFPVVFTSSGEHTIAVRYSFKAASDLTGGRGKWLSEGGFMPGFRLVIEPGNDAAFKLEKRFSQNWLEYVFIGLLCALALIHLLLFVFYPRAAGNLYYSFLVLGIALTILFNRLIGDWHFSVTAFAVTDIARQATQAAAIMSLLAFLYYEFTSNQRVSRFFWVLCGLWSIAIIAVIFRVSLPFPLYLWTLFLSLADSIRIVVKSLLKRQPGAWNIAAGIGVLVIGVLINVAYEQKIISLPYGLQQINLYIAILSVPVAVSVFLARSFARTNQNLEAQLVKEIEHEKERARLKIIEAENERRAKELEEARQLQLSMLPKKLPVLPNLEIAAFMKPATEVGGDYYDFHVGDDGTLTAAIGDATGHGLKAGTVVTAAKSLFNVFAESDDIPQIFRQSSRALKAMNLRGLFMAMTMMKIKGNNLIVSIAGMPPLLVYRAESGAVEQVRHKALPLGSITNFVYKQAEIELNPGDCVVAMSDGFPEMFNDAGEMLGYDKAPSILKEIAHATPQEVVNHFIETGEAWAGGRAQDDDVTFVVLKVKADRAER
ncbi:MAG TPA: SpoIIE family protein phosphatase, partial [Pyrinomonadaceae bacterium]|nr:SpoIIE family protein phosphatase [Pyrinomonadaceae bacterium]